MRKICALLTAALLLCAACGSLADGLVMAGFEDPSGGRRWENNLFFQRMEERTGLAFTFQQYGNAQAYDTWLDSLTPESDLPDVLFKAALSDGQAVSLYERGVLIDLRPYLEEHAPHLWALLQEDPDRLREISLPDGAVVTLPLIDPLQANNVLWINQTWLSRLGLEMPETAEELTEVLRAFRDRDPNRNGRQDEIPLTFSSMWDLRFLQHAYGLVMNDYYLFTDENGRVTCPLFTPESRAWTAWVRTLWEEGLLDRSGFSAITAMRAVTDSKADIPYGIVMGPTPLLLLPSSALSGFQVLPPLVCDGRRVYRNLLGSLSRGAFAVTSACADPAQVVEWVDFLYTEEGFYLSHIGLEGREYERHLDGTWAWLYDVNQAGSTVRRDSVIADSGQSPGYVPPGAQRAYDDAGSRQMIDGLTLVAGYAREACPQVIFTAEERAELATLWPPISRWCEEHLTWFVTGELPLNDETWAAFEEGAHDLGIDRVTEIWQQAVDRYRQLP